MGFLTKARAKANTFFKAAPSHLQKARGFLTKAAHAARSGHRFVSHVRQGVEENDIFNAGIKEKSKKLGEFADLGLQKIEELHSGTDKFLGHLGKFQANPTPGVVAT